jgi:hypothetical protein
MRLLYCTASFSTNKPAWLDALQSSTLPDAFVYDIGSPLDMNLFQKSVADISAVVSIETVMSMGLDPALCLPRKDVLQKLEDGELRLTASAMVFRDLYWLLRSSLVLADFSVPGFGQALFDVTLAHIFKIPIVAINSRNHTLAQVVERTSAIITPDNVKAYVETFLKK